MKRSDVVSAAKAWLGTKYEHQHRSKTAGVDCAGLVIAVAKDLNLVEQDFDVNGYDRVPDGKSLLAYCDRFMQRVEINDARDGDVVVIRWESDPQHLGFLVPYIVPGHHALIHSINGRGVIEHRLTPQLKRKIVAAYRLPGVE